MRIDGFWPADDETNERDRPMPPDGKIAGTIAAVTIRGEQWAKHANNPEGTCLKVVIDVGREWRPVESSLPVHWRGLICDVCRSARVAPPQRGQEWDEQSLVGKAVSIEIARCVSGRGTEYVRVEKWLEQASLPPAPAPRPPQAKRQAAAAHPGGDDDFPF